MTTNEKGFRQDIADAVLRLPVAAAFGLTFTALAHGRAQAELAWRPEHSHTAGAFQANPIAALADFTGVAAGVTLLPPRAARPPPSTTSPNSSPRPAVTTSSPAPASCAPASRSPSPRSTSPSHAMAPRRCAPPSSSPCATSPTAPARRRTPSDRARPSAQLPSGEPIPPLTRMPLHSPGEPAPGIQPTLNTAAETAGLFNLHPRVAINLHCIPTCVVEMQPSFIKRGP